MKFNLKEELFRNDAINREILENMVDNTLEFNNMRDDELLQLIELINLFQGKGLRGPAFEEFYFNYKIDKLKGVEFDFLKVNEEQIVNIEFKNLVKVPDFQIEKYENKLKEQLQNRRLWLSVFNREIISIGFILTITEKIFYILDSETFTRLNDINEVLQSLTLSRIDCISKVDEYLNIDNLNISPVNDDSLFVENKFELTGQQHSIIDHILNLHSKTYMVKGRAGTGKSIVAFLLAEELSNLGKNVVIFFMALNKELYQKFQNSKYTVLTLAESDSEERRFEKIYSKNFDVLIIDEAQRLSEQQIKKLKEKFIDKSDSKIVFFLDPNQHMVSDAMGKCIENLIEEVVNIKDRKKLTIPIRYNRDMEAFINKVFKIRGDTTGNPKAANVNIVKMENVDEATEYSLYLKNNYNYINLKPLALKTVIRNYKHDQDGFKVIGKEFDRILIPLDNGFEYSLEEGLKISSANEYQGNHNLIKLLYEIFTRVRKEITLIIIDNERLYSDLLSLKE